MKTFVENFLSSKPAEFYLKGINKLPENGKREFKIMAIVLLFEINSLLINKLYFTKTEIIHYSI